MLDLANRKERSVVTFDKDFGELIFREKLINRVNIRKNLKTIKVGTPNIILEWLS